MTEQLGRTGPPVGAGPMETELSINPVNANHNFRDDQDERLQQIVGLNTWMRGGSATRPAVGARDLRAEIARLHAEAANTCVGCEQPTDSVDCECWACKLSDLEDDCDKLRVQLRDTRAENEELQAERSEPKARLQAVSALAAGDGYTSVVSIHALRRALNPRGPE